MNSEVAGSFIYNLDEKARCALPPHFRAFLSKYSNDKRELIVLTRGVNGCIFGFPELVWEEYTHRTRRLKLSPREHTHFLRITYASTTHVTVDQQGRIKIPQNLIDYTGITKEVMVNGFVSRIEFWDPKNYDRYSKFEQEGLNYNEGDANRELFDGTDIADPVLEAVDRKREESLFGFDDNIDDDDDTPPDIETLLH